MPLTVAANVIEQLAYGYRTELEELARAAGSQRPGWMLDRQPERLLFGDESEAADVGFGSTAVGQAARQQSFAGCARRGDTETQSRGLRNGRLRPISTAHDRSAPRADSECAVGRPGAAPPALASHTQPYDCFGLKAVSGQAMECVGAVKLPIHSGRSKPFAACDSDRAELLAP